MKKNGFTLAELLIVVVILGVMGSIALPKYYKQKEKSVVAEAVAMLSAIRHAQLAYKLENGYFLGTLSTDTEWGKLGLDMPTSTKFTYSVGGGTIPSTGFRQDTVPSSYVYAQAARSGGPNSGATLQLQFTTGKWGSGTHPYQPENAT